MQSHLFAKNEITGQREIIGAILAIAFVSMLVLSNLFAGFSLPVYFLSMLPALWIAFVYPRSGFFAIIFLTFIFERFFTLSPIMLGRTEYKVYPLDFLIAAIVLGILISFLKGELAIKIRKPDVLVLIFMLLALIYGIFSIFILGNDAALAFSSAKNYGFYAILYFTASILIRNKEDFANLAKVVVAGGVAILGFLAYGTISGKGLWSEYTPLSTEGIRILAFTHAFYLSMLFVLAVAFIFSENKKLHFSSIFAILIPLWAIGIVGSMMRHLWVSLAVAVFLLAVVVGKKMAKSVYNIALKYFLIAMFLLVTIFYVSSILPNSDLNKKISSATGVVGKRITSIGNSSDESIFWRNVAWKESFKKYAESPVFGTGFGEYVSLEIGSYREFVEVRNIHNSFLVLLVQMGMVGIVFFGGTVFLLVKKTFEKIREKDGLDSARMATIGILALHLVAFVFQPYLETNLLGMFFWINLGLLRSLGDSKGSEKI